MRIAIVGAGSVGGALGAACARGAFLATTIMYIATGREA